MMKQIKNAPPKPSKHSKLKIRKHKALDDTKSSLERISSYREVVIPEKTSYKFKLSDVFEMTKERKKK